MKKQNKAIISSTKSVVPAASKQGGSETKSVIPIFFSIDSRYAPYFSVTLSSLLDHASADYAYRVIVLHRGLKAADKKRLRSVLKSYPSKNAQLDFVPMRRNMSAIIKNMEHQSGSLYKTLAIYFRLFIPVMFPDYEKAIYLDSDMVVSDDISRLYDISLGSHLLGAVNDKCVYGVKPFADYIQQALGVELTKYVNSGMLLMNMSGLREVCFHDRFLELMNRYGFDTVAPDQDYINVLCKDRILLLDERWNVMPVPGVSEMPNPGIVHYNLNNKPWRLDGIPYAERFWHYASTSPYYNDIVRERKNYDEPCRRADEMRIGELLECASRMVKEAFNFRFIYAVGLEMPL
ncbi:MAG: glycosyltransferase family 8 protein [Bacteroidaceae bacterium]|nr:glycosyltransferase family 8 protein [Bacteroidaceae bacterium]